MTLEEMIKEYDRRKASTAYILGFEYDGNVYYYFTREIHSILLKTSMSSDRAFQIRIKFNKRMKLIAIATCNATAIAKADELIDKKYNRGEMFEKIITERLTAQVWKKDNKPFYECGDIELNGEQIQIKFDNAELTNEKRLRS